VGSFINSETGNLKLAQNLLGHSTNNMTANVYTHVSRGSECDAAQAVERAIYGDLFPAGGVNRRFMGHKIGCLIASFLG
jgi:hypothetical protein